MSSKSIAAMLCALGVVAAPVTAAANEALFEAVQKSDHVALRTLLEQKADANSRRVDQSTPLQWAVDRQDSESVSLLLAAKADPNAVDEDGVTPLAIACELGDAGIVGQLLDAGAKANVTRPDGVAPIALCAGSSTPAALTRLITAGADVNVASPKGQTPVMYAAASGKADNIALLAQRGADVNRATSKGFTPLFFAVKSRAPGVAEAVIKAGANPKYVSPEGVTALELALLNDDFALATSLIGQGADVNRWDINGRQPLHIAAAKNNADLVKLLLAKGADPNVLTKQAFRSEAHDLAGRAVLKESLWPQNDPAVKVIIRQSAGGGVTLAPAATTPLMIAASEGSEGVMKLLIDAGAKSDFKAKDGTTLLFAAVNSGDPEVVRYALQLSPDVNATTAGGQSVMHVAVVRAKGEPGQQMIRLLADKGAKLDAKNTRGFTPARVAEQRSEPEIRAFYAALLKERGIKQEQVALAPQ